MTEGYATNRLSGIGSLANAAYSAPELEHQLCSSGSKALVTRVPLLRIALKAAEAVGIPQDKAFLFSLPGVSMTRPPASRPLRLLIRESARLPELPH
jgi:hypothetical protein